MNYPYFHSKQVQYPYWATIFMIFTKSKPHTHSGILKLHYMFKQCTFPQCFIDTCIYVSRSSSALLQSMISFYSKWRYRQVSNISRTKSQNLKCFSPRLAVVFAQFIEAIYQVENEDVVGAAPTGDAPTTYEWSTIWLPTKVRLKLESWR